jgi:predicted ATPase
LRSAFDKALGAAQQMVFIAGDPGVAKTALVDAFLAEIAELGTRREASRVIVVATCRRS